MVHEQWLCRVVLEGEGFGWLRDKPRATVCLNGQGCIHGTVKLKVGLNEDCVLRNREIFGGTCNELTSRVYNIN